ncbi:ABC transporter ATP-binding protein [Treponema sp. OMZ 305]|uniref:ABC transporter ATP-binding protein n=1 Tax=Treponema TaxID=157 RepID=UPI001BAE5E57|nr:MULTISPECIES: ABC transporter ATP-binding protein [Treponema]QUY17794.1 ABC transporter ATP-binding protein [Treponema vincentii]UTC57668.1 ABC transporter ATP-binding protein [Treponema sp. OMZ 305]
MMPDEILRVENLTVRYRSAADTEIYHTAAGNTDKAGTRTPAAGNTDRAKSGIWNVSFSLKRGERCGIIGESGGGKSTLLSVIMGLLQEKRGGDADSAEITGKIIYNGREIQNTGKNEWKHLRFTEIGLVFQNQDERLNPALTVGEQIAEILRKKTSDAALLEQELAAVLQSVGLEASVKNRYPHELSGGMRQRVFIAMAICLRPPLLLIDEPTTALDPASKQQILQLLKNIRSEYGTTMLIVSHDLAVIEALTDNLMVLLHGYIIEKGKTQNILEEAKHPYTNALLQSSTYLNPWKDLWGIKEADERQSCPFYERCTQKSSECLSYTPYLPPECSEGCACAKNGIQTILSVHHLSKTFGMGTQKTAAVQDCSLRVRHGEIVALLGKSGSGKTTVLHIIAGLLNKDAGSIVFNGTSMEKNNLLAREHALQIVEQDAFSSMNTALSVQEIIAEPSVIRYRKSAAAFAETAAKYAKLCGLPADAALLHKKARELSGGQRQKTAIARALSMQPILLLADEINAMLDDSSKVNIMRLLKQLQYELGFSMLLVTHDIDLVKKVADYVYRMEAGRIVEEGSIRKVFGRASASGGCFNSPAE